MVPVSVAVFKTKKGAFNFINKHPELMESDTVTIIQRNENRFDVVEYIRL
jgi:hypothetical protein